MLFSSILYTIVATNIFSIMLKNAVIGILGSLVTVTSVLMIIRGYNEHFKHPDDE